MQVLCLDKEMGNVCIFVKANGNGMLLLPQTDRENFLCSSKNRKRLSAEAIWFIAIVLCL